MDVCFAATSTLEDWISLGQTQTLGCGVAFIWAAVHWIHGISVGSATARMSALKSKTMVPLWWPMALLRLLPFRYPFAIKQLSPVRISN